MSCYSTNLLISLLALALWSNICLVIRAEANGVVEKQNNTQSYSISADGALPKLTSLPCGLPVGYLVFCCMEQVWNERGSPDLVPNTNSRQRELTPTGPDY